MVILSIVRIISVLIGIVGATFVLPIGVAIFEGDYSVVMPFVIPMICSWLVAFVLNIACRKQKIVLKQRSTFAVVALGWVLTSLFGAIPIYFAGCTDNFADAFFESISGFTTTGFTFFSDVEIFPRAINLFRCMTQWLGGMGIVAITVALLPILGVGGFQLIKAETTGPEKGKMTPKIATTAKFLWLIYVGLTIIETILLMIFGMDFVDAISHAFSTMGTGGFSTRNASIKAFNSVPIGVICTIFMFLSGVNFSVYFNVFTKRFKDIKDNSELKAYILIFVVCVTFVAINLHSYYDSFAKVLQYSLFHVASVMTTTGFVLDDYALWPHAAQLFLFLPFFVGGCSGSTAGGVKVVRWLILFKQTHNETKKLLHPQGVFTIKFNGKPLNKDVVSTVTAFMFIYFALIGITTVVGCLGKLDMYTSFTGAVSMVGNIGCAFGKLGPGCSLEFFPWFVKWWYAFAMLAGRLELYTMIVFFFPSYWRNR